ncbi:hypothetical protein RND71_037068 [Anisodus tanguticus]|uniref:Uncharacterized protein n=1 Tax=Anisodus tanguticus TaxID=243964 RepID=A0AAE1V0E6_9SOLA|nr:hypothetical protein RND71_037068 [Anisodus tanguticus]
MTTSHYLLLHLFIGLFFLSTPTLSRNIIREDTPIAPSPSEDTSTTVLSPLVAPIIPSTSGETTISPSPQIIKKILSKTPGKQMTKEDIIKEDNWKADLSRGTRQKTF